MKNTLRSLAAGTCLALAPACFAETIQINFGTPVSLAGWNNVPASGIGTTNTGGLANLVNSAGTITSVNFTMNARFGGTNTNGASSTTVVNNLGIPDAVAATSLYANAVAFNGITTPNPTFTLSNLDPGSFYTFTVYASRMAVSDNRTGTYTATGLNIVSGDLNASNNASLTLTLLNVRPNAEGTIVFDIQEATGVNTNGNGFTYLNALTLASSPVPEPSSAAALAGAAALIHIATRRPTRGAD